MAELEAYATNLSVEHLILSSSMLRVVEALRNITSSPEKRFLTLLGPKGFGKTCTLKYLAKTMNDTIYADLKLISNLKILDEVDKENTILLLDNAQVFKDQFSVKDYKLVVAAYSPNAEATRNNTKILTDHMGRTMIPMYYTPFNKQDMEAFLQSLGYSVVPNTLPITFGAPIVDKDIQQHTLDEILYMTNGNPRYIYDFLMVKNFDSMFKEHDEQFRQIFKLICDGATEYFASGQSLCKSIIMSFRGVTDHSLLPLGLVYKSCDSKIYLANNHYCKLVIGLGYLKVYDNAGYPDFHNLETLCDFVLASGCHSLEIPAVTVRIVQSKYEDTLPDFGVTLVRLKTNHPAIDFLVVDNVNRQLYMVQTSFQKYADRDTKYDAINSLKIGQVSVRDYYCNKTKIVSVKYIYATYRPTNVQNSHVTVLSLNNYPELLQDY